MLLFKQYVPKSSPDLPLFPQIAKSLLQYLFKDSPDSDKDSADDDYFQRTIMPLNDSINLDILTE